MKKFTIYLIAALLTAICTVPAYAVRKNNVAKTPARVTSGGTALYGYLGFAESDDFRAGLYEFTPGGFDLKWTDPVYADATMALRTGWMRDDRVCGFMPYYYMGQLVSVIYVEYDFSTGQVLAFLDQDANMGCYEICAFNAGEGMIYGYGFDSTGQWYFMKSPAGRPFDVQYVRKLTAAQEGEICSSLTWNPRTKMLYGVNAARELVTVTSSGEQRKVMDLDRYAQQYITGLCYAPLEDRYYWNGIVKAPGYMTEVSYLYSIDINEGTFEQVDEFANDEQFIFLAATDSWSAPGAPAAAVYDGDSFEQGALSGAVRWRLPSVTESGETLGGTLEWTASCDGVETARGDASPGETVSVEYAGMSTGQHEFSIFTEQVAPDGSRMVSETATRTMWTGRDIPATPAVVTLAPDKVSWTPVTEGAHGGWIDAAAVTYRVSLNGANEGSTSATQLDVALPENLPLCRYVAAVEAVWDDAVSAPGESNPLVVGKPLQLDVQLVPTTQQVSLMTTADVNGDSYGWFYNREEEALQSDYSEAGPMDDWIFLPVIDFPDAGMVYRFSCSAMCALSGYPGERMSVWFGDSPEPAAMKIPVLDEFCPSDKDYETYGNWFMIPSAMRGYIGMHASSLPNQYGIRVCDINISRTPIRKDSPSAVTGLKGVAAPGGALEAKVTFRMPETTMEGTPLSESEVLTATVGCGDNESKVTGHPGENVSASVATADGDNRITVSVSSGELVGPESEVTVYTGSDVPAPVRNLKATVSDDMMSLNLSWDAPENGANGGVIIPGQVTYTVFRYVQDVSDNAWQMVAETGKEKSFTYTLEKGSGQEYVMLGVLAANQKGDSGRIVTVGDVVGTPYRLPMSDDFEDQSGSSLAPWIIYAPASDYTADWGFGNLAEFVPGGNGGGVIATASKDGAKGRLGIPRFSTKGKKNISLSLDLYTGTDAAGLEIYAGRAGHAEVERIGTLSGDGGFMMLSLTLPEEYADCGWVQLYIDASFASARQVLGIASLSVDGETAGVREGLMDSAGNIYGGRGEVVFIGNDGGNYRICRMDGTPVLSGRVEGERMSVALERGLYVAEVGALRRKVCVR